MDNLKNLLQIKNGEKISRADIPQVFFADFSKTLTDIADNDGYIVQFFAYKEGEANNLLAVVHVDAIRGILEFLRTITDAPIIVAESLSLIHI